jgi:chemotaxis protein methyltransferase WspC
VNGVSERITTTLRRTAGLEVSLVGPWSVERAINARMAYLSAAGVPMSPDEYALRIELDPHERQWLIEAVVVPETWFFRHPQAFEWLARAARARLEQPSRLDMPLRIASVPCSTGEEPYSIAMALLDVGVPAGSFLIDAIDISAVALDQARQGIFGRNAFRGADLDFRARYFTEHSEGWLLDPRVRGTVEFRQGNLVSDTLFPYSRYYDFVFCRNVLIYFDRPTQQAALARLLDCLREDGHLFVGPAESSITTLAGFMPTVAPLAFAFERRAPRTKRAAAKAVALRPALPGAPLPPMGLTATSVPMHPLHPLQPAKSASLEAAAALRTSLTGDAGLPRRKTASGTGPASGLASVRGLAERASAAVVAGSAVSPRSRMTFQAPVPLQAASMQLTSPAAPESALHAGMRAVSAAMGGKAATGQTRLSSSVADALADAERLANQGHFEQAEAACEVLLQKEGPSADVYCLLGLIADASQRTDEARAHFRRAVYLDGTHAGALLQLAEHMTMDGDDAGAQRLLSRARRARPDLF